MKLFGVDLAAVEGWVVHEIQRMHGTRLSDHEVYALLFFLPRCRVQQPLELVSYLRTFITLGVEEEHKPRGRLLIDGKLSRLRGGGFNSEVQHLLM